MRALSLRPGNGGGGHGFRPRGKRSSPARTAGELASDRNWALTLRVRHQGEQAMSSMHPSGSADLAAALRKSLHEHWRLLLVEGIILVVLGAAAILVPPIAGLAATIFLG